MEIHNILGWIGAVTVIVAYALLSANKLKNGPLYQFLNLIASALTVIALLPKDAWFSVALNVAWAAIAAIALIRFARQRDKTTHKKSRRK